MLNDSSSPVILIVDDTPSDIRALGETLQPDYRVRFAASGKDAIQTCTNHDPPDLILLDIIMPEIDGYEVCRQLKKNERTRDIPIIFITAIEETAHKTRAFELGAVDYITKPFDDGEVRARVKTHLTLQQQARRISEHADELERLVQERTADLNEANNLLRLLAAQLTLAEERERQRIAMDLHDRVSQSLALVRIKLGALRAAVNSSVLSAETESVISLVEQAIEDTQELTFNMCPPFLYELGFVKALECLAEEILKQHGLVIEFVDDGKSKPLDEEVRVLLFRTVRELLLNVIKHAGVEQAMVTLERQGDRMSIVVADKGVGFDSSEQPAPGSRTGGFGLFSIRERLRSMGGAIKIESVPSRGTQVTLDVPLADGNKK